MTVQLRKSLSLSTYGLSAPCLPGSSWGPGSKITGQVQELGFSVTGKDRKEGKEGREKGRTHSFGSR